MASSTAQPTTPDVSHLASLRTHLRGHVVSGSNQPENTAVGRVGVASKVVGLVDTHAVDASTDLIRVARAGHVAVAGTVGVVLGVVAAPALFRNERRMFRDG